MEETIRQIAIWAVPLLTAVVFHETAHGWVANRLGDPTAARLGRLTLNPLAHIDLFGSIFIPMTLIIAHSPFVFGYAKPVPVNFHNLRHPKRDMIWVALAGPVMNLVLALVSVMVWKILTTLLAGDGQTAPGALAQLLRPLALMAQGSVLINIALAVFNALPLPPLDGGRVMVGLLPQAMSAKVVRVEPYGFIILFVLLMTRTLDHIIDPPMEFLLRVYLALI
ncbi:MAG: site-2 protease family protein [Candidatus Binatia bacterium]